MTARRKRSRNRKPGQSPDSRAVETNPAAAGNEPDPEPADEASILRDLVQGLREASQGNFVEESILDILREG